MKTLEVRDLSKSFGGVRALERVSFSVAAGERLALIGPNGAGKTTCFNLINGQLRADAGEILFEEGKLPKHTPSERCRLGIGRTFQVAATFTSMTARENVQVALHAGGGEPEEAIRLLELTGMHDQAHRPCSEMAYGDLKRVELAIALAARPRLLLMDEPTAGMATAERDSLMGLVARISGEKGIAVLFTEHDMDIVFRHANRVIVLAEGELLAQGTPSEVRADVRVRRVYLGEEAAHA